MNDVHSSPPLSGGGGFDSRDSEILIDDGPGDTTVRPIRPARMQQALAERARIASWQAPLDNKPPAGAQAAEQETTAPDQPHIYGHGVTEAEAEYVLRHPREDLPGWDNSRQALGQTEAGRYLRVIYVPDEEGDGLFFTANELRGKPLQAYRRRMRR